MAMIEHASVGLEPVCAKCGQPRIKHRSPRDGRHAKRKAYDAARSRSWKRADIGDAKADARKAFDAMRLDRKGERLIVGIDGEGEDTPDGGHIYTYLAAVNERGVTLSEAYNAKGLSHDECMEMLLAIPTNTLKFAFSFGYDITMMIREMPDLVIHKLLRPDTRARRNCKPCRKSWDALTSAICPFCLNTETTSSRPYFRYNGRGYDWFNNALTVANGYDSDKGKWKRSCHIWDSFRFFGTAFVEALKDWNIGSPEQRDRIADMKGKRGLFANEKAEDIQAYCKEECHLLALMMRKVINAHNEAGLPLSRFDGAGSTASVMLKKNGVGQYKGPTIKEMPPELASAIMAGFFGGRFENSIIGRVEREVYGFDISSAYPYAQTDLPCLKCGKWERANHRGLLRSVEKARLAICKYRVLPVANRHDIAWMPLPFRDSKGSICYPTNCEGWAWKPEMLSALAGWPDSVIMTEAYVYNTACEHKPFAHVPAMYSRRIEWGKEGAGKALKLGLNAGYGKNAQSVGDNPPYQQWAWAGMTTATTRAQILDVIAASDDRWNVLSIATDGVYGLEDLPMPKPRDTGTASVTVLEGDEKGTVKYKPLGGWERKAEPDGIFFAKPGLYFKLVGGSMKDIRARGVGRREVYEQKEKLMAAFDLWDRKDYEYSIPLTGRRFYGAKHCIFAYSSCSRCKTSWAGIPEYKCPNCHTLGDGVKITRLQTPEPNRVDAYGRWLERISRIRFDPRPKRDEVFGGDKRTGRLLIRDMGGQCSAVYKAGETSPEGVDMRASKEFMLEQPDWDEGK